MRRSFLEHYYCGCSEVKSISNFFKKLSILLLSITLPVITAGFFTASRLPSEYRICDGLALNIKTDLPVSVCIGESLSGTETSKNGVNAQLKLMGVIPIKNINVRMVDQKYVSLCGTPFGVKIFTDGVMVVGLSDIYTKDGCRNPADQAGIEIGDVITSINGQEVLSNTEVAHIIESSAGKAMKLTVVRRGKQLNCVLTAAVSSDDRLYKAGMWIRDSSAGIGTLTFIDEKSSVFGGLGHGICDIDTGNIIPLSSGEIVGVTLTEITRSSAGKPGELKGFLNDETLGMLSANSEKGVYGKFTGKEGTMRYAVSPKHEIREGSAMLLTTLPGKQTKFYDCEIEKINYDEKNLTRNLIIKITDKELLTATGGIVQGMSGSPIVQNGKFIGAVTHVFVNNPSMGYGIFAENMLDEAA